MTSPLTVDEELQWMKDHPDFNERPASIDEFLGEGYLNIADGIRPGVRRALINIFGEKSNGHSVARVQKAIFTGAIGIGKTTLASIALPYMCHWVLCLRDPQSYFDLLPGSRIAFMLMSTKKEQAAQVLFADIFARINHSPWFKRHPRDPKITSQIRFPKDIWIIPGDSAETTFEGYNILGGIVDEIDSHRVTERKDYAEEGYNTIHSRIESRFGDRGLLILIGQMKKSSGFAARKYEEFSRDSKASVARMTIWESFGWDHYPTYPNGTRDSFWYNPKRKAIVPSPVVQAGLMAKEDLIEIPSRYLKDFENDPAKALRDLAGIPPIVGSVFIGMTELIYLCRDRWIERYNVPSPVRPAVSDLVFEPWFKCLDGMPRALHLDIAYADGGDSFGMAMGHVPELVEVEDEDRPLVVIDFMARLKPPPGRQIILGDIRQLIYRIRDDLGFKINKVTMDGFQSTDMMQQLQKKRFNAEYLSMDRKTLPYQDLRDAIYERRLEFPPYRTYLKHGGVEEVEIGVRELEQLIDSGKKVDHPPGGSKDIADSLAGVVHTLMGDRKYSRGVSSSRVPVADPAAAISADVSGSRPPGLPRSLPIPASLLQNPPQLPPRLML